MGTIEQAVEVLGETERRLRGLVAQAAAAGEYDVVDRVTDGARTLAALSRNLQNGDSGQQDVTGKASPSTALDGATSQGIRQKASAGAGSQARSASPGRASATNRTKRQPAKGDYPKFYRRGDQLVKVGWSKKEREEYVHKAPRRALDALAAAITRRSSNGKPFAADEVFSATRPLKDGHDGSEIPGYQAYVALAWFKQAGIVKQHGRGGYSLKNGANVPDAVLASWQKLPEESAAE